jgi:hypothetical protein
MLTTDPFFFFLSSQHLMQATPLGWWFGVLVYFFFQLGGRYMG